MEGSPLRSVFFLPPLSRMSGGLTTVYDTVRGLAALGYDVALCSPGEGAPGFAEAKAEGFAALPWEKPGLCAADIWCVPEGWPNALAPGINAGARTVVYAQSWTYLLTSLPEGVHWKQLPVTFLAVSEPVAHFLREVLDVEPLDVLPPAVAPEMFRENHAPARPARIAWMPRKNRALAEQVQKIAEARLAREASPPALEWVPVQNMERTRVAETLASCSFFLNTAFPEGFGLPPLEAMAAGCIPVGFTGFGGWDYMRTETGLTPPCPLPDRPWGANGLFYSDGDVFGAGLGLADAVLRSRAGGLGEMRAQGGSTAAAYSPEVRLNRLAAVWERLASL